jgi:hypothetical protein
MIWPPCGGGSGAEAQELRCDSDCQRWARASSSTFSVSATAPMDTTANTTANTDSGAGDCTESSTACSETRARASDGAVARACLSARDTHDAQRSASEGVSHQRHGEHERAPEVPVTQPLRSDARSRVAPQKWCVRKPQPHGTACAVQRATRHTPHLDARAAGEARQEHCAHVVRNPTAQRAQRVRSAPAASVTAALHARVSHRSASRFSVSLTDSSSVPLVLIACCGAPSGGPAALGPGLAFWENICAPSSAAPRQRAEACAKAATTCHVNLLCQPALCRGERRHDAGTATSLLVCNTRLAGCVASEERGEVMC